MITAKNNIIVKIENSNPPEYAILNPLSGNFDILDENEYNLFLQIEKDISLNSEFEKSLLDRGYLYIDNEAYQHAYDSAYKEFTDEIDNTQIQLMLIPSYGCNLACTYCYQHGIDENTSLMKHETVDAFFDYARSEFTDKAVKPFITLFGGEPLVNSPGQRKILQYIIDQCIAEDYELSIVTNGYDFTEFVDMLKKVKIKEVQFTLDGSKDVHDTRRGTANKKGSFDRVVAGIEKAVENKMPVNLRSVVDAENIQDLISLAEFLDQKGWLELPQALFKTQIGRNYELFECYEKPEHLLSQIELWAQISSLGKTNPILAKFHRPDFYGIRYLVDTGELYMASFDTCPATKTEWVFDLYGDIYSCTATCGRKEFKLGTFWPKVELNKDAIETWKNRNVKNIPKCKDCKYDIVCGGGCGVVAANQHNGEILSPDCRPIQGIYEIGINYYSDEIKKMAEEDEKISQSEQMQTGCMICGKDLIYSNKAQNAICSICGLPHETNVKCIEGHFVCDDCHSDNIIKVLENILIHSDEKDPIKLANRIFELPNLKMHGPEYHSMVPGILIAAYQNTTGNYDKSKISEALRRGKDSVGGSCGFHGNCGAAVGAGIAESIINNVTPMSDTSRSNAILATGNALMEISKYGGPRCCKRETITSLESFIKRADYFKKIEKSTYICKQAKHNKDCIKERCPYFPKINKHHHVVKKEDLKGEINER